MVFVYVCSSVLCHYQLLIVILIFSTIPPMLKSLLTFLSKCHTALSLWSNPKAAVRSQTSGEEHVDDGFKLETECCRL